MIRHFARAGLVLAAVVALQLNMAFGLLPWAGTILIPAAAILAALVRYSWRASGYDTTPAAPLGRRIAGAAVLLALLGLAVGGNTAYAQDAPSEPPASPEPTLVESSSSPTSSAEPSPATPTPSSTPTSTTAASAVPAAPPSSSHPAAAPSSTRAPASASRTTRPNGTGDGAAAVPGPSTTSSTTARPTSTRYSALAPWIPADDHPEILLLSVVMVLAGGGGLVWQLERGSRLRRRREVGRNGFGDRDALVVTKT